MKSRTTSPVLHGDCVVTNQPLAESFLTMTLLIAKACKTHGSMVKLKDNPQQVFKALTKTVE